MCIFLKKLENKPDIILSLVARANADQTTMSSDLIFYLQMPRLADLHMQMHPDLKKTAAKAAQSYAAKSHLHNLEESQYAQYSPTRPADTSSSNQHSHHEVNWPRLSAKSTIYVLVHDAYLPLKKRLRMIFQRVRFIGHLQIFDREALINTITLHLANIIYGGMSFCDIFKSHVEGISLYGFFSVPPFPSVSSSDSERFC